MIRTAAAKVQKKSFVLGIDINDEKAQVSFMQTGAEQPDTLSVKAGAEEYDVPVILARLPHRAQTQL